MVPFEWVHLAWVLPIVDFSISISIALIADLGAILAVFGTILAVFGMSHLRISAKYTLDADNLLLVILHILNFLCFHSL